MNFDDFKSVAWRCLSGIVVGLSLTGMAAVFVLVGKYVQNIKL